MSTLRSRAPQVLWPYQCDSLKAVTDAMADGRNRLLVQMATGLGKTTCFASLPQWPGISTWLEGFPASSRKMLVICHRTELIEQAAARVQQQNPHLSVSIEQAEQHSSRYSDVVVASIQTLTARRCARLKRLMARTTFRVVVADESHHAPSKGWRTVLAMLGFLPMADASNDDSLEPATFDDVAEMTLALTGWDATSPKDRLLIGFTATPNRTDAIGLACVFQSIVYSYPLKRAIADKWLVPIVPWVIQTASSLDAVRTTAGEFNQKDLSTAVNTPKRNQLAVAAWHAHATGRPTLAFTVDVAHAHDLAQAFTVAGVRAIALSGETPKAERAQALQAFRDRRVEVVTNCALFVEGTDLPMCSCIVLAAPTKSATRLEQSVGRGLRQDTGKENCVVIDLHDVSRRHSLQAVGVLYGLPPSLKVNGKPLNTVEDELSALLEARPGFDPEQYGPATLEQLQAYALTFDIWAVPSMGDDGDGLTMRWMKLGDGHYRVDYPWEHGKETLTVTRDLLGHFEVKAAAFLPTPTVPGGPRLAQRPQEARTLAHGLATAREALRLAEAFVGRERRVVSTLVNKSAPWRSRPASAAQVALLKKLKAPFPAGLTKGQASDILNVGFARRDQGGRV